MGNLFEKNKVEENGNAIEAEREKAPEKDLENKEDGLEKKDTMNLESEPKKPEKNIEETRNELEKVYKSNEDQDNEKQNGETQNGEEYFESARNNEESIRLSGMDKVKKKLADTKGSQEFRDGRAKDLASYVKEMLRKHGYDLKDFKLVIDGGTGQGEFIFEIGKELGENGKVIGIDNHTAFSDKVKEELEKLRERGEDKVGFVSGDFLEEIKKLEDGSADLTVTLLYLLQELNYQEKIEVLKLVREKAKRVVVIEEMKTSFLKDIYYTIKNKALNFNPLQKCQIMTEGDWKALFEKAGFNKVEIEEIEEGKSNKVGFFLEAI